MFEMCVMAAWLLAGMIAVGPAQLRITVVDRSGGGIVVPCRIHLKGEDGQAQRAEGMPFWRDHFVCPGTVRLRLKPGQYAYEVERGPEYSVCKGSFAVEEGRPLELKLEIERLANLAAHGWWSGELHVHRPVDEIELLMQAEDLHVAPVITWWNRRNLWAKRPLPADPLVRFDGNRYYHVMAGEDERAGGALMYFNLTRPLQIAGAQREYPSPMLFLNQAKQHPEVWVDIEKPFWWDVPVWLASGKVDSIGLANNHMCRDRMYESEAWGKPRDTDRLPPPLGNGYWSQEIYYRILDSGLRLPPSAGSASGVLPNPVGYDRVYVQVSGQFGYRQWWRGLRAGQVFVTNGPLLLVRANGRLPGHVFTAPDGGRVEIELAVRLVSRDRIRSLELIKNGRVERSLAVEAGESAPSLGRVEFAKSGWFLVRAMADNDRTFRFASTGPFYVAIGSQRRISRAAAQFFLNWVRERMERIKLADPRRRDEVLHYHRQAERFWQRRVRQANAP